MRRVVASMLLVAACSKGPEADLAYISQARSLAAEWALINEQAEAGKLTDHYVTTMRQSIREELQTTSTSLTRPDTGYGQEIQALLVQPDDSHPDKLRAYAEKLKQIEDALESV